MRKLSVKSAHTWVLLSPRRLRGFARLSALCLLGLVAFCLVILSQQTPAVQRNRSTSQPPNHPTTQPPSPVTVRILFPTAEDSPLPGGIMPIVVEVRESLNERGVFWTERMLVGIEGQVLLDTTQLSGGEYDPATQQMVYRVLTPFWTTHLPPSETFVWTQAQWVGVPLGESNAPAYREGKANDSVDVTINGDGWRRCAAPTKAKAPIRANEVIRVLALPSPAPILVSSGRTTPSTSR